MGLCGTPDEEFMKKITSEEARSYIRTLPRMIKKTFKEVFKGANPDGTIQSASNGLFSHSLFVYPTAIDLLEKMLELDADRRYGS